MKPLKLPEEACVSEETFVALLHCDFPSEEYVKDVHELTLKRRCAIGGYVVCTQGTTSGGRALKPYFVPTITTACEWLMREKNILICPQLEMVSDMSGTHQSWSFKVINISNQELLDVNVPCCNTINYGNIIDCLDGAIKSVCTNIEKKNYRNMAYIIKEGDKFLCIKTVEMNDGEISYIAGRTYVSEIDNCITDEQGYITHEWTGYDISEYFQKCDNIDWEQRRYEIAKECLLGFVSGPNYEKGSLPEYVFKSLQAADMLIRELKKKSND